MNEENNVVDVNSIWKMSKKKIAFRSFFFFWSDLMKNIGFSLIIRHLKTLNQIDDDREENCRCCSFATEIRKCSMEKIDNSSIIFFDFLQTSSIGEKPNDFYRVDKFLVFLNEKEKKEISWFTHRWRYFTWKSPSIWRNSSSMWDKSTEMIDKYDESLTKT